MGGIYEVRRRDGLKCHNIHTKFHTDWFRHSKVDGGGGGFTDSMVLAVAYFLFFQNKESRLKYILSSKLHSLRVSYIFSISPFLSLIKLRITAILLISDLLFAWQDKYDKIKEPKSGTFPYIPVGIFILVDGIF
jgi:hypothetical protein